MPSLLAAMSDSYNAQLKLTTDIPNRNEELELTINKGEKEFLKGSLALTDETLGLKVPDLHDKYLAVENRDLKKIAQTFNLPQEYVDMVPDKIPSSMSEEDKAKLEALSTKLITKITEQVDETSYIAEKDIQININSNDIVADRYSLSINTKAMYTTITTYIKELFDDPDFIALCQDKLTDEQLENLRTSYDKLLTENSVDDIEDKLIKLSVYAADGKNVKTEITMDEMEASVIIENNETESIMTFLSKMPKSDTNDVGVTTTAILRNTFANNSGEFTYETKTEYNKDDINALQEEYDSQNSTDDIYSSYTNLYKTDYSKIYEDTEQKYIIKTTKSNDSTITGKIQFDGTDLGTVSDLLSLSFKCQFGNATVNTIDENNSIILNDYTMEDYEKLLIDLGTNAATTAMTKPESLVGMLLANISNNSTDAENDTTIDNGDGTDDFVTNPDDATINYDYNITPDESTDEESLYPVISNDPEKIKNEIDVAITNGLTDCLNAYKADLENNPEADLGIYLTVENVQLYCGDKYTLELLDSTTIKCTTDENGEQTSYYAIMNIDGYELVVTDVEVLTETDYLNR